MKAKITGGAAGLPNAAGDRGEAPGDGGASGWRSMFPDGYPPPAICSCCGTGAGRWSSELRRCARRRADQAAAPIRQPRLYARCRRRRSGSHCRHGRLDHQPGLSGWRIRIVLRGCHKVPDSDFGKSRTATWYPPTLGSRWCCLYSPSAFAVREHAETAADEANNGEGYTERILRRSCLQRLSGRAVTDGLNIGTAAVSTHLYRAREAGLASGLRRRSQRTTGPGAGTARPHEHRPHKRPFIMSRCVSICPINADVRQP